MFLHAVVRNNRNILYTLCTNVILCKTTVRYHTYILTLLQSDKCTFKMQPCSKLGATGLNDKTSSIKHEWFSVCVTLCVA